MIMTKMKTNTLIAILLLLFSKSVAQNVSDLPPNSGPFNLTGQTIMRFDERHKDIVGYPTYFENFMRGTVRLKAGNVQKDVLINYDCSTGDLIAKSSKIDGVLIVRKDLVSSFSFPGEIHFVNELIDGKPTFLWAIVTDSISLLCKPVKVIKGGETSGAYNTNEYKAREFVQENKFYLELTAGNYIEAPNKKKNFMNLFPEQKNHLEDYFKINRVNFSNPEDLRSLVLYLNNLLKVNSK